MSVLTLHRSGKVIPNPVSGREIEPGDRLLCFGKLEVIRSFIPEEKPKRRRPRGVEMK